MNNTNYKNWLKEMEDVSKDDILKFYYNLYFKYNKQEEVLDKIKEYIKENNNQEPWKSVQGDYILELLEEIE